MLSICSVHLLSLPLFIVLFLLIAFVLKFVVSELPIAKNNFEWYYTAHRTCYHIGFNCSWEFLGVPFSFHSSGHISWSSIAFLVYHQQSRKPISTILSRSERNKMVKRLSDRNKNSGYNVVAWDLYYLWQNAYHEIRYLCILLLGTCTWIWNDWNLCCSYLSTEYWTNQDSNDAIDQHYGL